MGKQLFKFMILAALCLLPLSGAKAAIAVADSVAPADTSSIKLGEATVTRTRLVFVTKKDTIIYDMDALGATKGDMLGDMIDKMPGLELRNGVLYFKGRQVSRLQVNGTDFVRGDTKKGLENLPSYIIKSVKAYEDKTDQAKATGIDDGVKEQVVNVILKKEYLGTWIGNADVGGGTDDRWLLRGFGNTFTDRMRFTVFGGFSNTGQYQSVNSSDGSWNDNGGAGGSSGDTKFMRPGFSLMYKNKKAEKDAGFFQIEANGGWDYRGHNDHHKQDTETYLDDGTSKFSSEENQTKNDEKIWYSILHLTMQPSRNTHIEYAGYYNYTTYYEREHNREGEWNVRVSDFAPSPLDSLMAYPAGWPNGGGAVRLQNGEELANSKSHIYGHYLWGTQKLNEKNLRLTLRHSMDYTYNNEQRNSMTRYKYFEQTSTPMDPLYTRYKESASHSFNTKNFADLNIPLKFLETLRFTYGYTRSDNRKDDLGFRLERLGGIFADYDEYLQNFGTLPSTADWRMLSRDADITLNSNTLNEKHWAEAYLQYNKHGLFASLQNTYRRAFDRIDYIKGDFDPLHPSRHANEYSLSSQLRYTSDSIGTFDLTYLYEISPQSINNDITIPDNSDPTNISLGNPGMKDMRSHSVNFKYDRTFKGNRYLAGNLQWNMQKNKATSRSTYDKTTGVTTTQPVTINGSWQVGGNINFSSPLDKKQRTSLNLFSTYSLNHSPYFAMATEGWPNRISNVSHYFSASARLIYRIEKFYVSTAVSTRYWHTKKNDDNPFGVKQLSNNYGANIKYQLPLDFEISTNVGVQHRYTAQSQTARPVRTVWNANITKSFLRDKSLAVKLECSDILNQRDQSGTWADENGRQSWWGLTVGRYYMMHIIYRFTSKKDK